MNNNSINCRRWHKEKTSVTLNVENFPHWVWGVEPYPGTDEYGQTLNRVFFIGDNIYNGLKADLWPTTYSNGQISTYLPWIVGEQNWGRTITSSGQTVRQAWEWKISPTASTSPITTTIYYDGSRP